MEKITSKSNNLIKEVKKLFTSRKARYENQKFVLEGARLCFDVLNSECAPEMLFVTQRACEKYADLIASLEESFEQSYLITQEIADKISDTQSTQGVFAVCRMRNDMLTLESGGKYIALDELQDPANLGAIIRTAEALGINGAILYNCCDLYNPKALRASMGSILRLPVLISENLAEDIKAYKANGFKAYAAVPDSSARDITGVDFNGSDICVIGNEGNGVSNQVLSACDELITINMLGRAESLNAFAAGAITMWEMLR